MSQTATAAHEQTWDPQYERWRHGGWYVGGVIYPSCAVGCVSNNFADKKWRIVCDPRPENEQPTFRTRDEAARAEKDLADQRWREAHDAFVDNVRYAITIGDANYVLCGTHARRYATSPADPACVEVGARMWCKACYREYVPAPPGRVTLRFFSLNDENPDLTCEEVVLPGLDFVQVTYGLMRIGRAGHEDIEIAAQTKEQYWELLADSTPGEEHRPPELAPHIGKRFSDYVIGPED